MALQKLTLLHNNDMHGAFLPAEKDGVKTGGISLLSGLIKKTRKENDNVVYANAGDMFRGSVIDSEYKGISTINLMNYLSPDVVTVGNHEVDYGIAHLLFLEKCAKFPIINANLYIKSNFARLFRPYEILNVNGLHIMFIGVLTDEVLASTRSEEVIGSFIDIWEVAREIGVIIDNYKTVRIDLTVLLTHIGIEEDRKLAALLDERWGVDLIIGGHSHTLLTEPEIVNGIPIVQTGMGTDHLGRFDLTIDDEAHEVVHWRWQCLDVNETVTDPDETMEELLENYKSETDAKYQRVVANFERKLTHPNRYQETELGNLFADLLQVDSSFEIMLIASGAIRKKEMGPILTYQDLTECLPYDDPVCMFNVTGKQFRHMMKYMLRDEALKDDAHSEFYQVSKGVRMVYDQATHEFEEFSLNGEEIRDEQMIRIAMTEGYHFGGFSEFFDLPVEEVLKNGKPRTVITSQMAIFLELLGSMKTVDSRIEGRIVIKNRIR